MNRIRKNPYIIVFFSFAFLCCLILSIVFFYINYISIREAQKYQNTQKVEMMIADFEAQLDSFEQLVLKLSITDLYQPYYLKDSKYNDKVMLEDFKRYQNYLPLTNDIFIHYDNDNIFCTSGHLASLKVSLRYLHDYDLEAIRDALLCDNLENKTIATPGKLFVIIPMLVSNDTAKEIASVCFVIDYHTLTERFSVVSGSLDGTLAIYRKEELLYCNQSTACLPTQKHVLTALSSNGEYTLCYLPEKQAFITQSLLPLQLFLILTNILLILGLSHIFARRSYTPILEIANKYRKILPFSEYETHENALQEIDYIIGSTIHDNALINTQLEQKETLLRNQILNLLLEGNYGFDMEPYLEHLHLEFPEPWFYVLSISFEDDAEVTDEFLSSLSFEMKSISNGTDHRHIHPVCYYDRKLISLICNISESSYKEELTNYISAIAGSFMHRPIIGVGCTYQNIHKISASWLESIDNISNEIARLTSQKQITEISFQPEDFDSIATLLANGKEEFAKTRLEQILYIFEKKQPSFFMMQYIFSDFLSVITRTAKECDIELSVQSLSLVISAKDTKNFREAANILLHEFCEKINSQKQDSDFCIYKYINTHYAEYDMSLEKTMSDLGTNAKVVRQAVFKYTGKSFKEYIIYLRIEYAKKLLQKEYLTVAEVGEKVGYSSSSHFIKVFKETTGITPAAYKANYKNMKEDLSEHDSTN